DARPERGEELLHAHHAGTLAQEELEQRERFGLDLDGDAVVAQLASVLVQLEASETEDHASCSAGRDGTDDACERQGGRRLKRASGRGRTGGNRLYGAPRPRRR